MTSTIPEAGKQQVAEQHEGDVLRSYLKRREIKQEDFARKLSMTVQNLSHHMRKPKLTDDFKRLLKENGISLFSEIENDTEKIENQEYITFNFSLKDKRLVKVFLPKDWTKEDLQILMDHLKLMLKSME